MHRIPKTTISQNQKNLAYRSSKTPLEANIIFGSLWKWIQSWNIVRAEFTLCNIPMKKTFN